MCLRLGVGLCYPGITHRCQDWEPQSSPTLWTLESHSFLDLIVGLSVLTPESILLEFLYMERNLFRDLFFFYPILIQAGTQGETSGWLRTSGSTIWASVYISPSLLE